MTTVIRSHAQTLDDEMAKLSAEVSRLRLMVERVQERQKAMEVPPSSASSIVGAKPTHPRFAHQQHHHDPFAVPLPLPDTPVAVLPSLFAGHEGTARLFRLLMNAYPWLCPPEVAEAREIIERDRELQVRRVQELERIAAHHQQQSQRPPPPQASAQATPTAPLVVHPTTTGPAADGPAAAAAPHTVVSGGTPGGGAAAAIRNATPPATRTDGILVGGAGNKASSPGISRAGSVRPTDQYPSTGGPLNLNLVARPTAASARARQQKLQNKMKLKDSDDTTSSSSSSRDDKKKKPTPTPSRGTTPRAGTPTTTAGPTGTPAGPAAVTEADTEF